VGCVVADSTFRRTDEWLSPDRDELPYGVISQTVDVAVIAIRQAITPAALPGRVVATINFLGMA